MNRVHVVGSVNLDLVVPAPHIPAPGETVLGSDLVRRPGGKGGNQAVAARRLGADVVLTAVTGDDWIGAEVRAALAAQGVDVSRVFEETGTPTGVALIVVDDHGENTIVVAPGANRRLDASRLDALTASMASSDVLSLQIEVPMETSIEAATQARTVGATVVLNAAPLPSVPDAALDALLKTVDVVIVNEVEALELAGGAPPGDPEGWGRLAGTLCERGPRIAVVTLGARGAVGADSGGTYVQPAFPVPVVDTTGAGDAFSGAFAVSLGTGLPTGECLRAACAAGALATTRLGAQDAMPAAVELDRFLDDAQGGE